MVLAGTRDGTLVWFTHGMAKHRDHELESEVPSIHCYCHTPKLSTNQIDEAWRSKVRASVRALYVCIKDKWALQPEVLPPRAARKNYKPQVEQEEEEEVELAPRKKEATTKKKKTRKRVQHKDPPTKGWSSKI